MYSKQLTFPAVERAQLLLIYILNEFFWSEYIFSKWNEADFLDLWN